MIDRTAARRVAALRQRERDAGMVRVSIVIPKDRKAELQQLAAEWRKKQTETTMAKTNEYLVTIVTANIRDVDGCDSDNAIAKIMEAAQQAADQFAVDNECNIELIEPEFPRDRQSRTIIVGFDIPGDYEAQLDAMKTAQEIEYAVGDAIDEAIQSGDWQDDAA